MLDNPALLLEKYLEEAVSFHMDLIRGNNPSAFTRKRILSPDTLIHQMMNRKGRTQWAELEDFYSDMSVPVTEKGFFMARKKINPEAIRVMSNEFIANMYDNYPSSFAADDELLVLAVDGSKVILPDTKQNEAVFGRLTGNAERQPVQALLSTLHDAGNNTKLDVLAVPYTGNEKALADKHIEHYCRNYTHKALFTFDRGYVSIRLIDQIINSGHYFLMRAANNVFKRYFAQVEIGEDRELDVTYDTKSTNEYRKDIRFRTHLMNTVFHLRFIKAVIGRNEDGTDNVEYLITNLPSDKYSTGDVVAYYWKRWSVETSYNRMKNRMKMEEFSGYSPELILQDIYADVWVYNMIALKILEANEKTPIEQKDDGEYVIKRNFNKAVGSVKNLLIRSLLCEDQETRSRLMEKIDANIESAICWVKKGSRQFDRGTTVNKSEYSYRKTY